MPSATILIAQAPNAERYLTRSEAAEILGLQPQTLAKWGMTGAGPKFLRLNARVVRYKLSDILVFLESSASSGK